MKILLSDGSGLTSRQLATTLGRSGHRVEVMTSASICLCRFTRRVRKLHRVPRYGPDPLNWLEHAIGIYRSGGFDLLLPTQEQVAVLSAAQERLAAEGIRCPLPPFAALTQVQDKVAAFRTLGRLGIPQPAATVVHTAAEVSAWDRFPVFVKSGIGTASGGVCLVRTAAELDRLRATWQLPQTGQLSQPLLFQQPVEGELVMAQAVFDHGRLIACHAVARVREGAYNGAGNKRSIRDPRLVEHLGQLGSRLGWHGALSADVIVTDQSTRFIDLNPRLVEPMSGLLAGVDLIGVMLDLGTGRQPTTQPMGHPGVATHQLLLRMLGTALDTRRRRPLLNELTAALQHRGIYADSTEELTPPDTDPINLAFGTGVCVGLLIHPGLANRLGRDSVAAYALTSTGWATIKKFVESPDRHRE